MVIEILLSEDLLTKTPDLALLIKEYDDLIMRKRQERNQKRKWMINSNYLSYIIKLHYFLFLRFYFILASKASEAGKRKCLMQIIS